MVPEKSYSQLFDEMESMQNIFKIQERMLYKSRWDILIGTIPQYGSMADELVRKPAVQQAHYEWHLDLGPIQSVVERTLLCMDLVLGTPMTHKLLSEFGTEAVAACMGFLGARFGEDPRYTPMRTMLANAVSHLAKHHYPTTPQAGIAMVYSRLGLDYEVVQMIDHSVRSLTHTAPTQTLH